MEEGYQYGAMSSGEMEILVVEREPERYTGQGPASVTTKHGDISSLHQYFARFDRGSSEGNGRFGFHHGRREAGRRIQATASQVSPVLLLRSSLTPR